MPAGGEADPGAQVAGDLEDSALFVEVDGVDGEAHEAHVDAVRLLEVQSTSFIKGRTEHEAFEPRPPRASDFYGERDGAVSIGEDPCFGHKGLLSKL